MQGISATTGAASTSARLFRFTPPPACNESCLLPFPFPLSQPRPAPPDRAGRPKFFRVFVSSRPGDVDFLVEAEVQQPRPFGAETAPLPGTNARLESSPAHLSPWSKE